MLMDGNTPLFGGSTILTLIAYGLFSAFVTGPVILERTIIKSSWPQECERLVLAELQASQPAPKNVPRFQCHDFFGGSNSQSHAFCNLMKPVEGLLEHAYSEAKALRQFHQQRLNTKAKASKNRCSCAATTLSEKRLALGLYAGTGRLVTPSLFKNLISELKTALHSKRCQMSSTQ